MAKIGIGVPTDDTMDTDCVMSLLKLDKGTHSCIIINQRGCYIDASRNSIVKEAQANNCDYLLFVDSDMAFPPDAFLKLIAEDKDIIGCNYAKRRPPHGSMATALDGTLIVPKDKGIEQCLYVGTGFVLIKMTVFDKLSFPWFETKWGKLTTDRPDIIQYGEDTRFCAKATQAGIPVFVHHELSWDIVHIGQFPYKLDMFCERRKENESETKR